MLCLNIEDTVIEPNTRTITAKVNVKCPLCGKPLVKYGYKKRTIKQVNSTTIIKEVYLVQRYKCTECTTVHNLLLEGWIPYKQYSRKAIETVLTSSYPVEEASLVQLKKRYKSTHFVPF